MLFMIISMLSSYLNCFMFISVSDDESSVSEDDGKGIYRRLFSSPTVIITLLSALVSSINWIIFDPILEPHMRQVRDLF